MGAGVGHAGLCPVGSLAAKGAHSADQQRRTANHERWLERNRKRKGRTTQAVASTTHAGLEIGAVRACSWIQAHSQG